MNYDHLKAEIERYGVHAVFGGTGELNAGIEQSPSELATFLVAMQELGVHSILEIGTGYRGGLSRFLVDVLSWDVATVDTQNYGHMYPDVHYLIAPDEKPIFEAGQFDLVLIDANHTYESVKADWTHYAPFASKAVALHDIAGLRDCEGVAQFWYELAYQGDDRLHDGYYEAIADGDMRGGIGWQRLT